MAGDWVVPLLAAAMLGAIGWAYRDHNHRIRALESSSVTKTDLEAATAKIVQATEKGFHDVVERIGEARAVGEAAHKRLDDEMRDELLRLRAERGHGL